jgi:2-dehydropantoate 2-reductase
VDIRTEKGLKKQMRILIIGAGSLGLLYGGYLAKHNDLTIICSERYAGKLRKEGLMIEALSGNEIQVSNLQIYSKSDQNIKDLSTHRYDICIIATKAYDLINALSDYEAVISNTPFLCLMQNGLGNEEYAMKKFPNKILYRIITSNGALMKDNVRVAHTGKGKTILCQINPKENTNGSDRLVESLLHELDKAQFEPEISPQPLETIWRKALINIGINPFGALTGLPNGKLLEVPSLPSIIRATVAEALQIANKMSIPLLDETDYTQSVFDVIAATARNHNSMLQDIEKGKSTEIDFLNGRIVEYAKRLGLQVPLNEMLSSLIHGLQKSTV